MSLLTRRFAEAHPSIAKKLGQRGLALLDVLLGMAIFALIAVIAVQAMGQFRERAYVTQVTSDVKQLSTGIEAGLTGPNATWESLSLPETGPVLATVLEGLGVNLTGDNTARVIVRTGDVYAVCVEHPEGPWAVYQSTVGAITDTGRSGGCPLTVAAPPVGGGGEGSADTDGDGISDEDEIADGTDPNDPNDPGSEGGDPWTLALSTVSAEEVGGLTMVTFDVTGSFPDSGDPDITRGAILATAYMESPLFPGSGSSEPIHGLGNPESMPSLLAPEGIAITVTADYTVYTPDSVHTVQAPDLEFVVCNGSVEPAGTVCPVGVVDGAGSLLTSGSTVTMPAADCMSVPVKYTVRPQGYHGMFGGQNFGVMETLLPTSGHWADDPAEGSPSTELFVRSGGEQIETGSIQICEPGTYRIGTQAWDEIPDSGFPPEQHGRLEVIGDFTFVRP